MIYLLDTNVLSEIVTADPEPAVAAWVSGHDIAQLYTTAISRAEIFSGLGIMPEGRRRHALDVAARVMFEEDFSGRVLPFDAAAADAYAPIFALRRRSGRPIDALDLMIAGIALSRGASVVTRNVSDFDGCGMPVIDPWLAG